MYWRPTQNTSRTLRRRWAAILYRPPCLLHGAYLIFVDRLVRFRQFIHRFVPFCRFLGHRVNDAGAKCVTCLPAQIMRHPTWKALVKKPTRNGTRICICAMLPDQVVRCSVQKQLWEFVRPTPAHPAKVLAAQVVGSMPHGGCAVQAQAVQIRTRPGWHGCWILDLRCRSWKDR